MSAAAMGELDAVRAEFTAPVASFRDPMFPGVTRCLPVPPPATLRGMLAVYAEAISTGNREKARYCRRQVIAAKDRAKFTAKNPRTPEDKRAEKEEMVQWMMVWLENPEVFPAWAEARRMSS